MQISGDCHLEIKRHFLLGRRVRTNLERILKSRGITLPTKVHIVKAIVFPVVMYRWESLYKKKTGHWRTEAFKLLCWKRLLKVPWTARRSNQSILKEINSEYSLEGLMLKLQYFGHHLMQRVNSLEKPLMMGKIEGKRRSGGRGWDGCMASLTQWTWTWANSGRYWRTGKPGVLRSMGSQRVGHDSATAWQGLGYHFYLVGTFPSLKQCLPS